MLGELSISCIGSTWRGISKAFTWCLIPCVFSYCWFCFVSFCYFIAVLWVLSVLLSKSLNLGLLLGIPVTLMVTVRIFPTFKFPDTIQEATLQADIFKDSSLMSAMITFYTALWHLCSLLLFDIKETKSFSLSFKGLW